MGKITVVVGPPCAGKSTFVQKAKKPNDVVVDADLLAQALGSEVAHDATGDVRDLMFSLRRVAISIILDGIKSPAWIIHTNPYTRLIEQYRAAGATFKLIDPGIEECLARAEAQGRPAGTDEAIRAWYANPPQLTGSKAALPVVRLPSAVREAFEQWAERKAYRLMVTRDGRYSSDLTESAWNAWKEARG
jgi:predicted kinase